MHAVAHGPICSYTYYQCLQFDCLLFNHVEFNIHKTIIQFLNS
jgi:hypothetical protein